MKNLVVCCDGTWNSRNDRDGGIPVPTNVVRLYNALADCDAQGTPQLKYYHPGVGTDGGLLKRMWDGGVGAGLGRNVASAYRWLGAHFEQGDRMYLFGFSRGAFTARSLGGMISKCGLLDLRGLDEAETWKRVNTVYQQGYRKSAPADLDRSWFHAGNIAIHFLGVWDTVGALGIPDDLGLLDLFDSPSNYRFHDTELGGNVVHARHAVALDEKRGSFTPTLWTNLENRPNAKQVWFPGVHCDVGGGYAQKGLSDGALHWMMDEVAPLGLALKPSMREQLQPEFQDVLHDSASGVFKAFKTVPRSIPAISPHAPARDLADAAMARQASPPIVETAYHPTALLQPGEKTTVEIFAAQHWNATGIYLESGARYRFAASGEWLDLRIGCGPDGPPQGFYPAYLAADAWAQLVKLYRGITGHKGAKLGMRREEQMPWFALVGAIANGGNPNNDGTPQPLESFLIGTGCDYPAAETAISKPGYLYCFANDIWELYGNNRGSVTLTVERLP